MIRRGQDSNLQSPGHEPGEITITLPRVFLLLSSFIVIDPFFLLAATDFLSFHTIYLSLSKTSFFSSSLSLTERDRVLAALTDDRSYSLYAMHEIDDLLIARASQ